jgi:MFS superfamily sulfate permease-like transporter
VGPDATTCAVIAAVVFPLSAGNPELHWQLTIIMTLMMGGWCLLASKFAWAHLPICFLIPSLRVCLMALP